MVYCVCLNCNSNDMKLSEDSKYLICNKCEDKQYVRDLEIGFDEVKEKHYDEGHYFTCEICRDTFDIKYKKMSNGDNLCCECFSIL